jgi:hypothetical protein
MRSRPGTNFALYPYDKVYLYLHIALTLLMIRDRCDLARLRFQLIK